MNIISVIIFLLFSSSSFAQKAPANLDECSQLLINVERSGENIKPKEITALLSSVNKLCLGSVEYSEWVNEIVYGLLIKKPKMFINSFSKQTKTIKKNIINEIESPIHDGIDLEKTYKIIKNTTSKLKDKKKILKAISAGGSKIGLKLQ